MLPVQQPQTPERPRKRKWKWWERRKRARRLWGSKKMKKQSEGPSVLPTREGRVVMPRKIRCMSLSLANPYFILDSESWPHPLLLQLWTLPPNHPCHACTHTAKHSSSYYSDNPLASLLCSEFCVPCLWPCFSHHFYISLIRRLLRCTVSIGISVYSAFINMTFSYKPQVINCALKDLCLNVHNDP